MTPRHRARDFSWPASDPSHTRRTHGADPNDFRQKQHPPRQGEQLCVRRRLRDCDNISGTAFDAPGGAQQAYGEVRTREVPPWAAMADGRTRWLPPPCVGWDANASLGLTAEKQTRARGQVLVDGGVQHVDAGNVDAALLPQDSGASGDAATFDAAIPDAGSDEDGGPLDATSIPDAAVTPDATFVFPDAGAGGFTCTSCHGGNGNPAPPRTSTTAPTRPCARWARNRTDSAVHRAVPHRGVW